MEITYTDEQRLKNNLFLGFAASGPSCRFNGRRRAALSGNSRKGRTLWPVNPWENIRYRRRKNGDAELSSENPTNYYADTSKTLPYRKEQSKEEELV